ncbi:uncharacterized protein LOC111482271 [Cucurbita maxima]|uniref:Uncharacterized protein LOC111482271 n=1 Tax=Cucurbita maxima TaxID=3661 RepID=A0A6J1J6S4_CUCMA|nr:uncharacterized protein LOC111482271 [Cucurbita maxima]
MLKEGVSSRYPNGTSSERIANLAIEYEKRLFKNAKSEQSAYASQEAYLNAVTGKMSRSENRHESASSRVRPAFVIQPPPQMSNQPHQRAVPNPLYQQPAVPNSLLQQHTQQLRPKPHGQLQRQKLNVRQTHQQIGMHNQSFVSPQNALNSPCGPQGLVSSIFTQNPNVLNLQPNENLTTQVKEGVIGEAFWASKVSHQHRPAIEQHKQHQSMGASAVPNGAPNSEDWHDLAFAEMEQLKKLCVPFFKKICQQYMQAAQPGKVQHHLVLLQKMILFLQLPRDRIILTHTKEEFYGCLLTIVKTLKLFENCHMNLANKQHSLHGQPGLGGSCINPVQQGDNVKLHFQPVNWAANVSPGSSSSIAPPRQKGSVRSEADWIQDNLSQNSQHSVNIKPEIELQSHNIRSSSATTSPLPEPANLGSNRQLSTATEPQSRLLKAVESMSNEALREAVLEISSVVNMNDFITEPWCHSKATHLMLHDGRGSSNSMKRKINAMALNDMPSPCSDTAQSAPTVSKRNKLKKLSDYALLEEMRNINKQFIETVLELDLDENLNARLANAGTVLRCSYRAVTDSKNSEAHPVKLPVLSVKLLVPLDYPEDYPVFLSKFNTDCGNVDEQFRELSNEATSRLRAFLRTVPECLSLEEYARAWNECARSVVSEYAQRAGGGCFSARYGTWEDISTN